MRAAHYDLPLMLAIIGGDPRRFPPYVDLYHRAYAQIGKPPRKTDRSALARLCRRHRRAGARGALAALQGDARPDRRRARLAADDAGANSTRRSSSGSLYVGSPETVARKIAATAKALGIARFDMKYSAGTLPHDKLMRSIELYGTQGDSAGARDVGLTPVARS